MTEKYKHSVSKGRVKIEDYSGKNIHRPDKHANLGRDRPCIFVTLFPIGVVICYFPGCVGFIRGMHTVANGLTKPLAKGLRLGPLTPR